MKLYGVFEVSLVLDANVNSIVINQCMHSNESIQVTSICLEQQQLPAALWLVMLPPTDTLYEPASPSI